MASPKQSSDALRDFLDDGAGHHTNGVVGRDENGSGSAVSRDADSNRSGVSADNGRDSGAESGSSTLSNPADAVRQPDAARARTTADDRTASNPAATSAARKRTASPDSPESLAKVIFTLHGLLARKTGLIEFTLSKEDANEFATAIQDVRSLYKKGKVSSKASAWFTLIIVVLAVYIPIFVALRARAIEENDNAALAA